MSQLDDIMSDDGIPALLDVFGDPVAVTPHARGSASFSITAMAKPEFRYVGDVVDIPENALLLQCAKADWAEPKREDRLVHKGVTYQVDRIEPTQTDAYFWAFWAIPV